MDSDELIINIARNWFPDDDLEITPVFSGTSCDTFFVQCNDSKYVLRGFASCKQAQLEACIPNKLNEIGISPEMIPAISGAFYVHCGEMYYNLQRHIAGTKPDFSNEQQIIVAATAVARMHKQLSDCTVVDAMADRFDTAQMLRGASSFTALHQLFPDDVVTLEERIRFIMGLEHLLDDTHIIHGDLGHWNMIWDGTCIYVIDFGECRLGDCHFDLAAVISCILSHSTNQLDFRRRFFLFKEAYEQNNQTVDLKKLRVCLYLWLLRGALASIIYIKDGQKQQETFTKFCFEISRVEKFYNGLG